MKPANFAELPAALALETINTHGRDEVGVSITDRGWDVLYPYVHVSEEKLEIKGMCVYPDVLLQRRPGFSSTRVCLATKRSEDDSGGTRIYSMAFVII